MRELVKWWNRNTDFRPILQSRLILYFFFFTSLITLVGFGIHGEYVFAAIFILVGFLTSFFSKNMIVILFLALAVTNIIIQGLKGQVDKYAAKEGMKGAAEEDAEDAPRVSEAEAKKEIKKLLDLQLKLMTGVNGLQPILKEVEGAISTMRNTTFQ
jgi:hypothetical protein